MPTPLHVMVAAGVGTEGINLQFCSLIVNDNLPWNPPHFEEQTGRIHPAFATPDDLSRL